MRKQGTIRRWEADRGFGFIDSGDASHVFFHVRDFARGTEPAVGMRVSFEEIQVGGKGPRAMSVMPATSAARTEPRPSSSSPPKTGRPPEQRRRTPPPAPQQATGSSLAMLLMVYWIGVLAYGVFTHKFALWIPFAALVLNLITFGLYAKDKNAAQTGAWRTSEATLHTFALLGGWPAAWWAQQWLRHKSSKREFRVMYWLTVLANCAALSVLTFSTIRL